ncbi:MAG: isoprenylcysteine carboxylmethyltransferase family protein [Jaaginema sp. PMC 1079.18]|nr:isoprenylcysteine carboxylmethyltransferase family protein [Jaaginema sp. PMC 1080.18]MEC4853140.1 isoprenylcysteine carboxylmethyltransferase family protein [Jaaginema sp. PMC 1079.18]MEC4864982.1 isoprenylcysteine carboxylmethyltransferase family protein [Jaaginema sp. PMC 1078.18]
MPLQARKQLLAILVAIALVLILPAFYYQVLITPEIIFAIVSYFSFFGGLTVWRIVGYGSLTQPQKDAQLQDSQGRWLSVMMLFGLIGVHSLGIYEFSRVHSERDRLTLGIGIIVIFTAIILSQTALRKLGKFFDRMTIQPEHRLITTGIYRYIRHPVYTSYILLFCGYCFLLQAKMSLGIMAILCFIWFRHRMIIEEKMLVAYFGRDYQNYCRKTKRLLPFIY